MTPIKVAMATKAWPSAGVFSSRRTRGSLEDGSLWVEACAHTHWVFKKNLPTNHCSARNHTNEQPEQHPELAPHSFTSNKLREDVIHFTATSIIQRRFKLAPNKHTMQKIWHHSKSKNLQHCCWSTSCEALMRVCSFNSILMRSLWEVLFTLGTQLLVYYGLGSFFFFFLPPFPPQKMFVCVWKTLCPVRNILTLLVRSFWSLLEQIFPAHVSTYFQNMCVSASSCALPTFQFIISKLNNIHITLQTQFAQIPWLAHQTKCSWYS